MQKSKVVKGVAVAWAVKKVLKWTFALATVAAVFKVLGRDSR
jgi:hypothetical protein